MNEDFERQFFSGCLGPQITTKIGFTDKKCCSNAPPPKKKSFVAPNIAIVVNLKLTPYAWLNE
jgi:hypothetical protein